MNRFESQPVSQKQHSQCRLKQLLARLKHTRGRFSQYAEAKRLHLQRRPPMKLFFVGLGDLGSCSRWRYNFTSRWFIRADIRDTIRSDTLSSAEFRGVQLH